MKFRSSWPLGRCDGKLPLCYILLLQWTRDV